MTSYKSQQDKNQTNVVRVNKFLIKLGLDEDGAIVYTTLLSYGPLTVLNLSRKANIPRTMVYRIVDELVRKGLLEEIVDENTKLYSSVEPDGLTPLVNQRLDEAKQLANNFPQVKNLLLQQVHGKSPDTKVAFYKGKTGIKQMVYNVLSAKTEVVGYTFEVLESITGNVFAKRFYEEFVRKNLKMRDVYSDVYLKSANSVNAAINNPLTPENWHRQVESRYLPDKDLFVNVQMDIYNDVISYYSWHEGEVFGVEIKNRKVADFQRQIFEMVWEKAKPEGR